MKKSLLFTLLISFNLCSQELWKIDPNNSSIKYSGSHYLHNWNAQNNKISGLLNVEDISIKNIGVIAKVKDFNSGNSSLDSNAMRVVEALKYPNVIFRSSYIEYNNERIYIEGFLEFHGIKKNFKVEGKIAEVQEAITSELELQKILEWGERLEILEYALYDEAGGQRTEYAIGQLRMMQESGIMPGLIPLSSELEDGLADVLTFAQSIFGGMADAKDGFSQDLEFE